MAAAPKALSETVTDEQLNEVLQRVTNNAEQVDKLVFEVVRHYCAPVDLLLDRLKYVLQSQDISDKQLDHYILNIPAQLYFTNTVAENLGIRDDIARLLYKEAYNKHRQAANGTVADKSAQAEMHSNAEALAAVVYNRAAKMVRSKMDMAYEMLAALKKVVSHRMAEKQLANSDTGRTEK